MIECSLHSKHTDSSTQTAANTQHAELLMIGNSKASKQQIAARVKRVRRGDISSTAG